MRNNKLVACRNVRNSKQTLVDSIMAKIEPIVKNVLNEGIFNNKAVEENKSKSWYNKEEDAYTEADYIDDFTEQDGKNPIDVPEQSVLFNIINNIGGYTYVINVEYKNGQGRHLKSLGKPDVGDATYETYYDCNTETLKNALLEISFNQNVKSFQIGSDHNYTETFEFTRFVREDCSLCIHSILH